jgi:eukaryotic translation initiation factor 2C
MVKTKELPLIKEGCKLAGARAGKGLKWLPRITLLVVGKRHHAKFYPVVDQQEKAKRNFRSGLVVDTDIVAPDSANFYLQSHDSYLGTARSAHYTVIINESGYKLDQLQEVVGAFRSLGLAVHPEFQLTGH